MIDKNASLVLESDEFEDIDLELLKDIMRRDSLQVQSGEVESNYFTLFEFHGEFVSFRVNYTRCIGSMEPQTV